MKRSRLLELLGAIAAVSLMMKCTMMLEQGTAEHKAVVFGVLLLYVFFVVFLLWRSGLPRKMLPYAFLIAEAAMCVRVLCFDHITGDYTAHLSRWYEYFCENGGFRGMAGSVGDYNVPYLYFMAAISYLRIPDLYLIKLFSVFFDVLLAWGGYRFVGIVREGDWFLSFVAFCVLLFLPTVVLNGAYWGQCDSIYGALCLHGLCCLLTGKNKRSAALIALAFTFKLQAVFLMPLWGVFLFAKKIRFRELLVFPPVCFGVSVPALLLGKPLSDTILIYFRQMTEYPSLTMNGPSVYQFIPYKMEVNTEMLKWMGILAAFVLCVGLLIAGLRLGKSMTRIHELLIAAVLCIGVPFLLPHMHERYFFLGDVLTVCIGCIFSGFLPVAVLVNASSLLSYLVFLRCAFNKVIYLGEHIFVMPIESGMMLLAFISVFTFLVSELMLTKKTGGITV